MIKEEKIARSYCANYTSGVCLGVMMNVKVKAGHITEAKQWRDEEKAGKLCAKIIQKDGCNYFEYIVLPAYNTS
tara:strand:- start:2035 stop:2256 length:222 start_codon:yes stop_codon:yes gene_type:complete